MRLLTLAFPAAADFLTAYDDASRTLVAHTKTEAEIGENLLVEISFPNLPNRPLLRATCCGLVTGGLRLELDEADGPTREFLVKLARGEPAHDAIHREHKRIPTTLPVEFQVGHQAKVSSHVEDLSAGGCFVRTDHPPHIGESVMLEITPPDETPPLKLSGMVAWVRAGKEPGFGVEFDAPETPDGRRLRMMLRRAVGTGDVDL
jgi:uncharacterized protein (TIGR02266 family)